jgi:hypothetical protein
MLPENFTSYSGISSYAFKNRGPVPVGAVKSVLGAELSKSTYIKENSLG